VRREREAAVRRPFQGRLRINRPRQGS
jgi:hypothetical protein